VIDDKGYYFLLLQVKSWSMIYLMIYIKTWPGHTLLLVRML